MQHYTHRYNEDMTVLTIDILNNITSIDEAIKELQRLVSTMKTISKSDGIPLFIREYYEPSSNGRVPSNDLMNLYCHATNEKYSPQAFGRLMTNYINSEENIFGISRISTVKGACYKGIKQKVLCKPEHSQEQIMIPSSVIVSSSFPETNAITTTALQPPVHAPILSASPYMPPPLPSSIVVNPSTTPALPVQERKTPNPPLTLNVTTETKPKSVINIPRLTQPKMAIPTFISYNLEKQVMSLH